MPDYAAEYRAAHERICALVRAADDDELSRKVPGCPAWSAKDLVAHLVGVAADSLSANIEDMGGREWTTQQVASRREHTVADLIEEWRGHVERLETGLNDIHPALAGGLIGDVITHEQDLRGALDRPGARDEATLELAIYTYMRFFGTRVKKAGLPAVELRTDGNSWVAGAGEPGAAVTAEPFELLRALTGRRTRDQVRAMKWEGDPEPYVDVFANYPYTKSELPE